MSKKTLQKRQAELRQSIEDLAKSVVMGGGEDDWDSDSPSTAGDAVIETLKTISQQAQAAECGEVAAAVSSSFQLQFSLQPSRCAPALERQRELPATRSPQLLAS